MTDVFHRCRVCGYREEIPPWGEDGFSSPSYRVCPCCGTEHHLEDRHPHDVVDRRAAWLCDGAPWFDESKRPADWDLIDQLSRILPSFAASPVVTSVADFEELLSDWGPTVLRNARFASGSFLAIVRTDPAYTEALARVSALSEEEIRLLMVHGTERTRRILQRRVDLSLPE